MIHLGCLIYFQYQEIKISWFRIPAPLDTIADVCVCEFKWFIQSNITHSNTYHACFYAVECVERTSLLLGVQIVFMKITATTWFFNKYNQILLSGARRMGNVGNSIENNNTNKFDREHRKKGYILYRRILMGLAIKLNARYPLSPLSSSPFHPFPFLPLEPCKM